MPLWNPVRRIGTVFLLVLILGLGASVPSAQADVFPLQPDFRGSVLPADWVLGGGAYATAARGIDAASEGWLRLTEARGNQNGYAYYNVAFPSDRGLVVTFDYAAWGGSGADGLTFFLFDGATTTFSPGGFGGSLGYAQRSGIDGLSNGYLGVGVDEFGNFSRGNEGRIGGPGFIRDAIAIRGPGSGRTGYAYVAGTTTFRQGLDFPRTPDRPNQGSDRFRRVEIRLEPGVNGYTVEVYLQSGFNASLEQVIAPTAIGQNPPATLKMGFAASTGGATNYHEIRNLSVTSTDTPTELSGTVTESGGGQPVPGAAITVVDADGHTINTVADASGQWSISSETTDLVAGTATVTASYSGFCAASGSQSLAEGVPNTLNLTLTPTTISGVVSDAASGAPVVGATVVFTDAVGTLYTTSTALGGVFSFENSLTHPIATGNVSLSASKLNYVTAFTTTAVTDCGPNDIPLGLDTTDIWFYKSDGRVTASPGQVLTYTLTAENHGSISAEGVVVVDELLAHEYVTIMDRTPGAVQVGPVMTWTLPSALAVDASHEITLVVRISDTLPDGDTVLANYAHALVTGSPEADRTSNEQSDLTTVTAHPNLTIFKSATTDSTPVGNSQLITYTLTGDNRGNAVATGVVITDALDGLVTYVPGSAIMSANGTLVPVTVAHTTPDLVFELPSIPPGISGLLTYTVQTLGSLPPGTEFISNTASVVLDQQDNDASNNSDSYQMPAQAFVDLHVAKLAIPEFYPSHTGGLVCTKLRYGNFGTTAATNATLTDTLPTLASYVPGSLHLNGTLVSDPLIVDGVMDLTAIDSSLGDARSEGVITYTLQITDALPSGVTAITNTAIMSDSGIADVYQANNSSSAATPIEAAPELEIALDDGLVYTEVGDTITWTVTVRNTGDQVASNVAISVTLGDNVAYVPGSASHSGAYDAGTSQVEWDLAELGVGQVLVYTVSATVSETHKAGSLAFAEAEVSDDGTNGQEASLGDNYAIDCDKIIRPYVVLSKTMSDDVQVGQPVTFTLGYRNYSKAPGRNVVLTDTLPDYLDFVDATGNWSQDGDAIVWDLGTVAPKSYSSVQLTTTLSSMPETPESVSPSLDRGLTPMQEIITSTLTDVSSPWYVGTTVTPTVRVLWQDDQAIGPRGWHCNPRVVDPAKFWSWPAPVPAGIEVYWLPESDLGAQWIAHDLAGQVDPNYSFFRHIFYLPLNIVQASVGLDMAADDLGEAYINGVYVGQDYGGGGATELYDVQGIQAGANVLGIRLLNNDHGGHAMYADPQGRFMCHPGILYRMVVDYKLRPFVQAPQVVREGDTFAMTIDEAVLAGEPPYSVNIDYGEGLAGTSSLTHVYTTTGSYTVTVQVTDTLGQIGRDVFTVTVQPAYSHLVVNNVDLEAHSTTHTYTSQGGTANDTFIGLEQVLGIHKSLVEQVEQPDGSHRLSYQITISSTRVQIDGLPLYDSYDPSQMTLVAAEPAPNSEPYAGLAIWDDLTGPAPNGFDRALASDDPMVVSATFVVGAGVSGMITNTAWVDGAQDDAGLTVNDGQADMVLELARPSAAVSAPVAWGDAQSMCAGWHQRWTLTATNDGDRALTNVTLTAIISDTLALDEYDIVWEACSPGATAGDERSVSWSVPILPVGDSVERELVLRPYSNVPAGRMVEICTVLDSDQHQSEPVCSQGEIEQCAGPTPTPVPTDTPSPEPTVEGLMPLYLPLVLRN